MNKTKSIAELKAREDLASAYKDLHALVTAGGSEQDKRKARKRIESREWDVFRVTGDVYDMPPSADSGN